MTYNLALELKEDSIKYDVNFRTSVFHFRPYHGTEIYEKFSTVNLLRLSQRNSFSKQRIIKINRPGTI